MPNHKFVFGLALLALIFLGISFKPELLGTTLKNINFSSPSLACNSSDLLQQFQRKFDEKIAYKKAHIDETPLFFSDEYSRDPEGKKRHEESIIQNYRNSLDRAEWHVERTETLGQIGNLLSCRMEYTREKGQPAKTFQFLLGRDDQGRFTVHHDPMVMPPYE